LTDKKEESGAERLTDAFISLGAWNKERATQSFSAVGLRIMLRWLFRSGNHLWQTRSFK